MIFHETISEFLFVFAVPIHAIGDKANDMLLDMINRVVDLNGVKDGRFQVCSDSYFRIVSFPRTLLSIYLFILERTRSV